MITQIAAIAVLVLWPIFGFKMFKKDKGGIFERILVSIFFGFVIAALSIIFVVIVGLLILMACGVIV